MDSDGDRCPELVHFCRLRTHPYGGWQLRRRVRALHRLLRQVRRAERKLAYTILAASFVYSFGIIGSRALPTFRFTAIDEAFLKSSDESARFGLELFRKMGLQLLVVTPLSKIPTIEPYISHLGFVSQNEKRQSQIRSLTIGEYRKELKAHEKKV